MSKKVNDNQRIIDFLMSISLQGMARGLAYNECKAAFAAGSMLMEEIDRAVQAGEDPNTDKLADLAELFINAIVNKPKSGGQ